MPIHASPLGLGRYSGSLPDIPASCAATAYQVGARSCRELAMHWDHRPGAIKTSDSYNLVMYQCPKMQIFFTSLLDMLLLCHDLCPHVFTPLQQRTLCA